LVTFYERERKNHFGDVGLDGKYIKVGLKVMGYGLDSAASK
jgi:hypothetical protein